MDEKTIKGLGKNPGNNLIQNSNELIEVLRTQPLVECQLVVSYLGRINTKDSKRKMIEFEKGEFEKAFNMEKIPPRIMKERMKRLLQIVISVERWNTKTKMPEIIGFPLFDRAVCTQDETGIWIVSIRSSEDAEKYIFDLDEKGLHYLQYRLRNIIPLKSKYSLRLFLYLENNRHLHLSWDVSLKDLKEFLGCNSEKTYNMYKDFNKFILKKSVEELNDQTECRVVYTPIKRSRTVVGVRFILESLSELSSDGQLAMENIAEYEVGFLEKIEKYCRNLFKEKQYIQIADVLINLDDNILPKYNDAYTIEQRRLELLNEVIAKFEITVQKKEANGEELHAPFSYFKKILDNEIKGLKQPRSTAHNQQPAKSKDYEDQQMKDLQDLYNSVGRYWPAESEQK